MIDAVRCRILTVLKPDSPQRRDTPEIKCGSYDMQSKSCMKTLGAWGQRRRRKKELEGARGTKHIGEKEGFRIRSWVGP